MVDEPPRPIPINFGDPDPNHVVGRRELLREIRRHLDNGSSVLVTADRRRGKSWAVKALKSAASDDWVAVYVDVERMRSVAELLRVLAERLCEALPPFEQLIEEISSGGGELGVAGNKTVRQAKDPSDRLWDLVRGLADRGKRLLIVLDELPIMARTMAEADPAEALHLLRTLRALRHEEGSLRLVCAGSIGFHHVHHDEVEVGAALNDLQTVPVGPLSDENAVHLARCLLLGIGVETAPDDPVAAAIADATDGVPFYAHKLVDALDQRLRAGLPADYAAVWATREAAISQLAGDPWELGHYAARLQKYYGPQLPLAEGVLDALAREPTGILPFDVLLDRVRVEETVARLASRVERTPVLSVVRRLGRDHYLNSSIDGGISFTSTILRDGWRAMRFVG